MCDKQQVENFETHRERHKMLHGFFDELMADFISQLPPLSGKGLSNTTIMELMVWSYKQTRNPTLPRDYQYPVPPTEETE